MRQRLRICLHASLTASLRLPLHRRLIFVLVGSSAPPESRDATKGLVGTPWVIKAMLDPWAFDLILCHSRCLTSYCPTNHASRYCWLHLHGNGLSQNPFGGVK